MLLQWCSGTVDSIEALLRSGLARAGPSTSIPLAQAEAAVKRLDACLEVLAALGEARCGKGQEAKRYAC